MRCDKFLNAVNITKNRNISQDMIEHKVVLVNNLEIKPSKELKVGDVIEIRYLEKTKKYQVLQIPTTKTTPKSKQSEYVKEI